MVVFDSSVLLLVLDPNAKPPDDPATEQSLDKAAERIKYLIRNLTTDKEKIVIPTPVLSEVLGRTLTASLTICCFSASLHDHRRRRCSIKPTLQVSA